MDINKIIIQVIFVLLTAGAFWAWTNYIKPWLQSNHLMAAAQIAVRAAQAAYGRYNGASKAQAALQWLAQQGWDINASQVIQVVNATWQRMNTQQIASGEKEAQSLADSQKTQTEN